MEKPFGFSDVGGEWFYKKELARFFYLYGI